MKAMRIIIAVLTCVLFGLITRSADAKEVLAGGKRSINVMTVNLYVGGDPFAILALDPTDPAYQQNLVTSVTTVYYEILTSQPALRLQGVADRIAACSPDIVAGCDVSIS